MVQEEDISLLIPRVWVPEGAVGRVIFHVNATRTCNGGASANWLAMDERLLTDLPNSIRRPIEEEQPGP